MRAERVVTIEYLEPSMAEELLCKFPDESAFDFDYSQSAIWSPLLPRGRNAVWELSDEPGSKVSRGKLRKVMSKLIEKKKKKKKSKKKTKKSNAAVKTLDFSPCSTPGWRKLLRAGMKRFKGQSRSRLLRTL